MQKSSHKPDAGPGAVAPLGSLFPDVAVQDADGAVDMERWSLPVYVADYGDADQLTQLCVVLKRHILPFQDTTDPALAYARLDSSMLPPEEREGLALARIPRSRIVAASDRWCREGAANYWDRAASLFALSAIYRARVFAWLGGENLLMDCSHNLWVRENLLCIVRTDVHSGNRLTQEEAAVIAKLCDTEPREDFLHLLSEIRYLNEGASQQAPAVRNGMPRISPSEDTCQSAGSSSRLIITLAFDADGQASGFRAAEWQTSFKGSVKDAFSVLSGDSAAPAPRVFVLKTEGSPSPTVRECLGIIEDSLDEAASRLRPLLSQVVSLGWSADEVNCFGYTVFSLTLLRELRPRLRERGANGLHDQLKGHLARVWDQHAEDFALIEVASGHLRRHFRGWILWPEVRQHGIAGGPEIVRGSQAERQPKRAQRGAQQQKMRELSALFEKRPEQLLRPLWIRYLLPSSFHYWPCHGIFADYRQVDHWEVISW